MLFFVTMHGYGPRGSPRMHENEAIEKVSLFSMYRDH